MNATPDIKDAPPPGEIYRAFWRWHFYAGLLVLPVLMLMALTGGLYLFKNELTAILHRPLVVVADSAAMTPPSLWISAAEAGAGGEARRLIIPAHGDRAVQVAVESGQTKRTAYVDPHSGRYLGATQPDGAMGFVKRLHSLDIAGPVMNYVVEIVAGWAIVLVATGVFLWWPRGQGGGVVTVRGAPAKRLFWRDLHAVTGAFAGAVIVFLAVTGMPWSAFWGKEVRRMTTEAGLGRPRPPVAEQHHVKPAIQEGVPWAVQTREAPSSSHEHHHAIQTVDDIVRRARDAGLTDGFTLTLPKTSAGTWTAAYMPDRVEKTRAVYFDGGDGRVLADLDYRGFGAAAKTIEWGIAVHEGRQYGLVNKLIMLSGCVAVWLLGVSALVMWWKRRPKGRLAAPAPPVHRRAYFGLLAVVAPLAAFYPLVGASLIAALVLDFILRRTMVLARPQTGA